MDKRDSRKQLRDVLNEALYDAELRSDTIEALMEQYPVLSRVERGALVHLSNREADRSLRESVPKLAEYDRQRLSSLADALHRAD